MKIDYALRRIKFRLENDKRVNQTDATAFETIVEFVENNQKKQIEREKIVSKLFTLIAIKYFESGVKPETTLQKINRHLRQPYEMIKDNFIDIWKTKLFRDKFNVQNGTEVINKLDEKGVKLGLEYLEREKKKNEEIESKLNEALTTILNNYNKIQ
jgi:ABC-type transporter Mla MlaB component